MQKKIIFAIASTVNIVNAQWQQANGHHNAKINCIAVIGSNVFVATSGSGRVHHSANSGSTWTSQNSNLSNANIRSLAKSDYFMEFSYSIPASIAFVPAFFLKNTVPLFCTRTFDAIDDHHQPYFWLSNALMAVFTTLISTGHTVIIAHGILLNLLTSYISGPQTSVYSQTVTDNRKPLNCQY
jgi:hypothetical protein